MADSRKFPVNFGDESMLTSWFFAPCQTTQQIQQVVISWVILWVLEQAASVTGSLGAIPQHNGYYLWPEPVLIAVMAADYET